MTTSAAVMARRVDARIIASSVFPATPSMRVAHALAIGEIADVDGDHVGGSHRLHDVRRHVVHGAAVDRAPGRSPGVGGKISGRDMVARIASASEPLRMTTG